jgi:hypothetical protein
MKKTISKKLVLSRQTLRLITGTELERVAGGQTLRTCSDLCGDTNPHCNPDTQFIHGCQDPTAPV